MGPITLSDHVPISRTLNIGPVHTRIYHWRLNKSLLKKLQNRAELWKHIVDYINLNEGSVSSIAALWEAHKVVIRWHCIAMGSKIKKDVALHTETLNATLWKKDC